LKKELRMIGREREKSIFGNVNLFLMEPVVVAC
jgi:hypothetical protein